MHACSGLKTEICVYGVKMSNIQLWRGSEGLQIPSSANTPESLVSYAVGLSDKQKKQIALAFEMQAYEMGAEYAWRKAITKLKETLEGLGPKFLGELLGKDDISEYSGIDEILTDYSAIMVAEQLGVIGKTAALRLKQNAELITHFFSKNSDEEIEQFEALQIVSNCIKYILSEDNIEVALEFSRIRDELLNKNLSRDDSVVDQIISAPLFYLRTLMSVLTNAIKTEKGAKLEHASANLNLILPHIWSLIGESEKWTIGLAYRDVTAEGNKVAISALKSALIKVNGFDYVPENLRSLTYRKTAKEVIDTHFSMNNFHNETRVIKKLANLGSVIPSPAFPECMTAYLSVYLGNMYGHSFGAEPVAKEQLVLVTKDRWKYYFENLVQNDQVILEKIMDNKPFLRLSQFLNENTLNDFQDLPSANQILYDTLIQNRFSKGKDAAKTLVRKMIE